MRLYTDDYTGLSKENSETHDVSELKNNSNSSELSEYNSIPAEENPIVWLKSHCSFPALDPDDLLDLGVISREQLRESWHQYDKQSDFVINYERAECIDGIDEDREFWIDM